MVSSWPWSTSTSFVVTDSFSIIFAHSSTSVRSTAWRRFVSSFRTSFNSCDVQVVFVLHGYVWIHWVAESCTTIEHPWSCLDSLPSLRTWWSTMIKSSNFAIQDAEFPFPLLQWALVILIRLQTSQFWSFLRRSGSESWEISADADTSAISRFSTKFSSHSGTPCRHIFPQLLCCSPISRVSSYLRVVAGPNETNKSCGGDVEEEVPGELDEDPGTTNGTKFSLLQKIWFPLLVRCDWQPLGNSQV